MKNGKSASQKINTGDGQMLDNKVIAFNTRIKARQNTGSGKEDSKA